MAKQSPISIQKYAAEGLAVFCLTLGVSLSLIFDLGFVTPVVAGLIVGLFVYTIGPISGAHINPAVTVGLWSVGKLDINEAARYIGGQIIGALAAMLLVNYLYGGGPELFVENSPVVGFVEMIGAFILVFGVASVAYGRVDDDASGLVVGGSLTAGIIIASSVSNGVLNPAVALGIGSFSLMYILGPLVGGVFGAWCYKWLIGK